MQADQGILTGCDINYEWMLKWWWSHYAKHNQYPVAFCDFGMSKSAQIWCASKGTLIKSPNYFFKELPPSMKVKWQDLYPEKVHSKRTIWFKKPCSLLSTPFEHSIWIDIDCEVMQNLSSLFEQFTQVDFALCLDVPNAIAIRREKKILFDDEKAYLTGVIAFQRSSPLLAKWVENCLKRNQEFFSEQDALNRTIYELKYRVQFLDARFNYGPCYKCPKPENLVIYHHLFTRGKNRILQSLPF